MVELLINMEPSVVIQDVENVTIKIVVAAESKISAKRMDAQNVALVKLERVKYVDMKHKKHLVTKKL